MFGKYYVLLPLFLAYSLCLNGARKPNVIYILADDLGYGDLSAYGQTHFETPNLDFLAAGGMKFTQHYSGSTVCAPSRCALMTGKHIGHAVVRGNLEVQPEGQQPMPADTFTMAHMFKDAGYTTGLFGKWGLGAPGSVSEPLKMGFDRFYGYNCQRHAHHYYPYYLWDNDQRELLWGNFGMETETYAPDLIQEKLLTFVETNKDRPFFAFYALVQPHAEMFAPETVMEKYRGRYLPESSYEGTDGGPDFRKFAYGSQPEGHAAFAAMVDVMDDDIGELVAKLEELGIAENTLILFTSDNGPHQEGGHDPGYFQSNGGLRGYKRDLYEGGIRVPMVAYWPGKIEAGSVTDHISAFWDVFPTMAELTGEPSPDGLDGISFLPTLFQEGSQYQHPYLYWEFHERKGRVAIRKGKWKGVRYDVSIDPESPLELYDLSADPSESQNIAARHPNVVRELDRLIKEARTVSPVAKFNFPDNRQAPREAMAHER
jgi:arylsulfatase A